MKHLIAAFGVLVCATAFIPTEASAVVCARGVVRAGCASARGAVVVHKPVVVVAPVVVAPVRRAVHCRYVNGVRVCH
jgi:hypothetical protein